MKKRNLKPAGKALAMALACAFAVAGNSLVWAQSATKPTSQLATELPAQNVKQKVIPDVWVMSGSYKNIPGWQPAVKPVLTTESFEQLRQIPCVASVTARRYDLPIALRAKDGKSTLVHTWVVDTAGLEARGLRLSAKNFTVGSYYLSPPVATHVGLPIKAAAGQVMERLSYLSRTISRGGVPVNPPEDVEVLIDTPSGQVRSLKLPYGGTVDADLRLLSQPMGPLALRFEPLFRSSNDEWSAAQLHGQQLNSGTVVYARTKPGLTGPAREACRAQLDAHMQSWAKGLPQTKWEMTQLKS